VAQKPAVDEVPADRDQHYRPENVHANRGTEHRQNQSSVDRMTYECVVPAGDQFRPLFARHRYAPIAPEVPSRADRQDANPRVNRAGLASIAVGEPLLQHGTSDPIRSGYCPPPIP